MGCRQTKEEIINKIIELSNNVLTVEELDTIIFKTGFNEKELLNLIKIFMKLKPSKRGKLKYAQFLQCPFFKYSPFGWHLLEAFELIKDYEEEEEEDDEEEEEENEENEEENEEENDEEKKSNSKKSENKSKKSENKSKKNEEEKKEEEKNEEKKSNEEEKNEEKKNDEEEKSDNEEKNEEEKKNDDEEKKNEDDINKTKKSFKSKDTKTKKSKEEKKKLKEEKKKLKEEKRRKKQERIRKRKEAQLAKRENALKMKKKSHRVENIYRDPEEEIPDLNFKTFCEILYIFSQYCTKEKKTQSFFKLYDFDNDGRIGINDIKTYLKNLKTNPFILQKKPKDKKEDEESDDSDLKKENSLLKIEDLLNKDEDTQIAQIVIREATSGNKDYLDYFDFRYMFLNTQFLSDYHHFIDLDNEVDVEPNIPKDINEGKINVLNDYNEQD